MRRGALVVIGVGSLLRRDDGAGVRVVERLRDGGPGRAGGRLPAGTRVVDGGTLGLDLLPQVHGARGLVLVDAVRLGGPAGRVTVLRGTEAIVEAGGTRDGAATDGVGELLSVAGLMGWLPKRVTLVGIEAGDLGEGLGLSAAVERAIPAAVAAVGDELHRMDERAEAEPMDAGAWRLAGATA